MTEQWDVRQGKEWLFEENLKSIFYGWLNWEKEFLLFLFYEYMQNEKTGRVSKMMLVKLFSN